MAMKILIFAPYAINTPHFETELEIAQRHLDSGDQITLLACNGHLPTCDVNPTHTLSGCLQCLSRRVEGLKLLSERIQVKPLLLLSEQDRQEQRQLKTVFPDFSELKRYRIEDFEIGYAALSSLISLVKDSEPDLKAHEEILRRLIIAGHAVYRSVQNYLTIAPADRAYVYNGRYAPMRAAFRACKSRSVECFLHERGGTFDRFYLVENDLLHDYKKQSRLMQEAWAKSDPVERERQGSQMYIDNSNSISHRWVAHSKDQEKGRLPEDWDDTKNNVVLFSSSEHEYAAIGDMWNSPLYQSHFEGLQRIIASVSGDSRVHLYLRIHPNLKGLDNQQTRRLKSLSAPNLTVIPAESPISSYALLFKASKIVTYGSTLGIEAVYWGTPSILAGQSHYRDLGGNYTPQTHDELIEMLYAKLAPKDKTAALIYGFYWSTRGDRFKYFKPTGLFAGEFKGKVIKPLVWNVLAGIGLTRESAPAEAKPTMEKVLPFSLPGAPSPT